VNDVLLCPPEWSNERTRANADSHHRILILGIYQEPADNLLTMTSLPWVRGLILDLRIAFALAVFPVLIRWIPTRHLVRLAGLTETEISAKGHRVVRYPSESDIHTASSLGMRVAKVARVLAWNPACLARAFTVLTLVRRHNIHVTLHLGVNRDSRRALTAHAWLSCGDTIVVGALQASSYLPVASYSTSNRHPAQRDPSLRRGSGAIGSVTQGHR
jgi:hypothetical protein